MVRVKICGITSLEDAVLSINCGAAALGFNFYPESPRYIEPEQAARIIQLLTPFVLSVGVFVNENQQTVKSIAQQCGLDSIQLHGDESIEYCEQMRWKKLIKVIRVKQEEDLEQLALFPVDYILLDTYHRQHYGGTGEQFNWKLLEKLDTSMRNKIIVAGGITPNNIDGLLNIYTPIAIDVCSGVESSPGKKDGKLLHSLFEKVTAHNSRI